MTTTTENPLGAELRRHAMEAGRRFAEREEGLRHDGDHVELTRAILAWAAETYGDHLIVASNMQDAALGGRDAVAQTYGVRIVEATPELTVAEQDRIEGKDLFATDPGRCCALRKVEPLRRALEPYDAWVTGVRRVEAPTRAQTPLVTWDERHGLVKVNPIAHWSDDELQAYIAERAVLVNPLVDAGYPSIGCAPCTQKPAPGADPRSGRWAGFSKTECGLHG